MCKICVCYFAGMQSPLDLLMPDMAETKKTKKEILDYDWKKENNG
jgi:hypothetical protein